ncbi:hypothetical protein [Streptomyces sp. NPDC004330]|uniref:hypothetical protein n=1 Tax=Streptomyces sp. NPDC004330 TaxID=3364700 RepID=UPI0036AA7B21
MPPGRQRSAITVAGFVQAQAPSRHTAEPASASQPLAADRTGFVLSEGAVVVVLESAEHATARGARIHAGLAGVGIAADAHPITAPATDGSGKISAMRKALTQARMTPQDMSHVNAHITGTPVGDAAEARAIREVFGRATATASKAALGHLFGAAGAIEALIAPPQRAARSHPAHPQLHHRRRRPRHRPRCRRGSTRRPPQRAVLSNCFGFGGQNVSLVVASAR